jgi:hypothetical protein
MMMITGSLLRGAVGVGCVAEGWGYVRTYVNELPLRAFVGHYDISVICVIQGEKR